MLSLTDAQGVFVPQRRREIIKHIRDPWKTPERQFKARKVKDAHCNNLNPTRKLPSSTEREASFMVG